MALPYPTPDPATGNWDAFALKRNLDYLDHFVGSAVQLSGSAVSVLFRSTGHPIIDLVNSSTETTLFTTTIGGDIFGSIHTLYVIAQGDALNNTGVDQIFTLRCKLGGTTFYTVTPTWVASATRRGWNLAEYLTAAGTPTNQFAYGNLQSLTNGVSGLDAQTVTGHGSTHNAGTVNLAVAQTFTITGQLAAADPNLSLRPFLVVGLLL